MHVTVTEIGARKVRQTDLTVSFFQTSGCSKTRSCSQAVYLLFKMPTFVLVRWVEDNSIGVMPVSAAEKGTRLFPGLTTSMKWRKKKYEAEILKISRKPYQ